MPNSTFSVARQNSMRLLFLYFLIIYSCATSAQTDGCPDAALLNKFAEFDDLYIGELHGTNEIPIFYKCLIDYLVRSANEPIIVSLEMAENEVDPDSNFWGIGPNLEDGRSSKAMFAFVQYLSELESRGAIWLHFQHNIGGGTSPKNVGDDLRIFSENNHVIAFSGNVHSMKYLPPNFPGNFDTEGMFVGPNFTHISISSVAGGEIWACMGPCGTHTINPYTTADAVAGKLVDGQGSGHDYIYYLETERLTASEPMVINKSE